MSLHPVIKALLPMLLAIAAVLACRLSPPLQQEETSGVIMRLPSGILRYLGDAGTMSTEERQLLPGDTEIVRTHYRSAAYGPGTQDQIEVTLVLAGAERRSIHRPEVCLTGQGWTLLNSTILPVEISPGRTLKVRDLFIEKIVPMKDGTTRPLRAHYVYWFVGTDVTTPSHFERIWLTTWDSVTRNLNHRWAYPSVMALVTDNFSTEELGQRQRDSTQTLELITQLIQALVPKFQKNFAPPKT
jgi:hypothetical protein